MNRVAREALIYDSNDNYNQTNGNLIEDQRLPMTGDFTILIVLNSLVHK